MFRKGSVARWVGLEFYLAEINFLVCGTGWWVFLRWNESRGGGTGGAVMFGLADIGSAASALGAELNPTLCLGLRRPQANERCE